MSSAKIPFRVLAATALILLIKFYTLGRGGIVTFASQSSRGHSSLLFPSGLGPQKTHLMGPCISGLRSHVVLWVPPGPSASPPAWGLCVGGG